MEIEADGAVSVVVAADLATADKFFESPPNRLSQILSRACLLSVPKALIHRLLVHHAAF